MSYKVLYLIHENVHEPCNTLAFDLVKYNYTNLIVKEKCNI